jgi:hypothetical protein
MRLLTGRRLRGVGGKAWRDEARRQCTRTQRHDGKLGRALPRGSRVATAPLPVRQELRISPHAGYGAPLVVMPSLGLTYTVMDENQRGSGRVWRSS